MIKKIISGFCLALFPLVFAGAAYAECCLPCGQENNIPLPNYGPGVQPFENYLATAERCCARGSWFDGFFVGTGFGVIFGNNTYSVAGTFVPVTPIPAIAVPPFIAAPPLPIVPIPPVTFTTVGNATLLTAYFSVGYTHTFNWFYLSAELAYRYRSYQENTIYTLPSLGAFATFPIISPIIPVPLMVFLDPAFPLGVTPPISVLSNVQSHNAGTFDLLPGFLFTPRFVVYGRFGVEHASYHQRRTVAVPVLDVTSAVITPGILAPAILTTLPVTTSDTQSSTSPRLGIGAAFAAGRHISFSIDYVHTFVKSMTFTVNPNNLQTFPITLPNGTVRFLVPPPGYPNAIITTDTFRPQINEVDFGVKFTF